MRGYPSTKTLFPCTSPRSRRRGRSGQRRKFAAPPPRRPRGTPIIEVERRAVRARLATSAVPGSAATHSSFLSRPASSSAHAPDRWRARGSGTHTPTCRGRRRGQSAPNPGRHGPGARHGAPRSRAVPGSPRRRATPTLGPPAPDSVPSALGAPPSPPRLAPARPTPRRWVRRTHPLLPAGAPLPAAGPPAAGV